MATQSGGAGQIKSIKDQISMKLIRPHGCTLVNREVAGSERARLIESAADMPALRLGAREISDLEMIATGAYSPLEGFLDRSDYSAVCSDMRLANGVAWPIPVTLPLTDEQAGAIRQFEDVALYQEGHLLGILHLADKYRYNKVREAELVYRTTDLAHPGVSRLYNQGDCCWEERLVWSTVQSILVSRNIEGTPQRHALFSWSVAGGASLVFKRAIRFIAPMNTCKSVRWKSLMGSFCIRSSVKRKPTTFLQMCVCSRMKPYLRDTIPHRARSFRLCLPQCATLVRGKRSFMR